MQDLNKKEPIIYDNHFFYLLKYSFLAVTLCCSAFNYCYFIGLFLFSPLFDYYYLHSFQVSLFYLLLNLIKMFFIFLNLLTNCWSCVPFEPCCGFLKLNTAAPTKSVDLNLKALLFMKDWFFCFCFPCQLQFVFWITSTYSTAITVLILLDKSHLFLIRLKIQLSDEN